MRRSNVITALLAGLVGALVAVPISVYASHSFNDVPASNTFHEDIAWLRQSGVTFGCNPPANTEFCPKDNVTREQMSAFMRRLAQYIGAEDGTPALANNSQRLQGRTAAQLTPRAAFNSDEDAPDTNRYDLATEITAPAPGLLLVSGGVERTSGGSTISCRIETNDTTVPGSIMQGQGLAGAPGEDCTTGGAVVVEAGTHAVELAVSHTPSSGFATLGDAYVWALWVPFDGTGAVPTP